MNRVLRFKLLYVLAVVFVGLLVVAIYVRTGTVGLVAAAILLIVPGRIGGYYLGKLFRSRKLISLSRFDEAIEAGKAFLEELRRQPWRRHFIYCFFGLYTWDVEAMARNNIGAARMQLGDIEKAERDLGDALEKDPDYPIPYFNLAIIAYVRDDTVRGDNLISVAAEKGYSGGSIDNLISRVGEAYAHLQARA
jgi:tetratricopeptide (TPR) repeat protein